MNLSGPDPAKIGKYEIRGPLGAGAMGMVYEGYDPFIQRPVAIKTVRRELLAQDDAAEMGERFRREAQAAGRLTHPNIVGVYEYGEDQGLIFIAMEHVQGEDLKAYFSKGARFRLRDTMVVMRQILSALEYSHRQGVVHRDVKPGNIIIAPGLVVKVMDFGIAHLDTSDLTQAGDVLGTPTHMSPEQFMGQPVDGRSDLFSAAVILYEMLTGDNPFAGSSHTSIMHKVLKLDPIKPSELNVHLSAEFDLVMQTALAKRPDDRYPSARDFYAALGNAYKALAAAQERARGGTVSSTVSGTPPAQTRVEATQPPTQGVQWDADTLQQAEQRLARYIGPMARILVRREAPQSPNLQELNRRLAAHIDQEADREAFLAGRDSRA